MTQDKSAVAALAVEPSERLAINLAMGRTGTLEKTFRAEGSAPPFLLWSPTPEEIRNPLGRAFAEKCTALTGPEGLLRARDLDPEAFGPIAGNIMILSATDCPRTFHYDYYGKAIIAAFGQDMTGRTTQDFARHIAVFFSALYQAARSRREWVLSEHEPPRQIFVQSWLRIIVPAVDEKGEVTKFIVFNHADNALRAGLEIIPDPVLVVDGEGRICHANPAANAIWSADDRPALAGDFTDITGLPLPSGTTPEKLLHEQRCADTVELTLRNALITRFAMTVSATLYREQAFYVVSLRMMQPSM
ncbi:MAG: PAS domain-containing protein [Pseudomonadota bacterium]